MSGIWSFMVVGILALFFSGNEYSVNQPESSAASSASAPKQQSPLGAGQKSIPPALQAFNTRLTAKAQNTDRPATQAEIAAEEELMLDIGGLIFEETMTKIGYEFYEYFTLLWQSPQFELKDYNILITEKASPIWGSWIKVIVNEKTIWEMIMSPRSSEVEDAVNQALEVTKEYLANYDMYQFESEDLVGSGI